MSQIYTGYFIKEKGEICDSCGFTNTRIEGNAIINTNGQFTGYKIHNGNIITSSGENTGYSIIRNTIFGPFKCLPWL
ncbi:hypothetical protein ACG2F4_01185 [Halalkalibaculum sp. DA3122]|uniref:hypothetical protein n=1 Tax=unclassified Halalkalibaculum TaxID=2964617 RepID=UPI003754AF17